ncbi:hypothetical protein JCM3775_002555 [Rhodotorula graminis]
MFTNLGHAPWAGEDRVEAASSSRSTPADDAGKREPEPNTRAPVLFSSRRTFSSKSAFFDACKVANLAEYGYTTHQLSSNVTTAVVCCAGRRHERCPMQVAAFLCEDDRWAVDSERCRWAHTHARDDDEVHAQAKAGEQDDAVTGRVQAAEPSRSTARERASEDESDLSDETDGSEELSSEESSGDEYGRSRKAAKARVASSSGEEEDEDSQEDPTDSTSGHVPQLPMPKLPAVGDTFASPEAFEVACVLAVIRVYGYSVSKRSPTDNYCRVQCNYRTTKPGPCPFELIARKNLDTGLWVVCNSARPRIHNHGRNPRLARDSMWLPTVVCETARAALGLAPGKRARDKARRDARARRKAGVKQARAQVKKRQRVDVKDENNGLMPPPQRPFAARPPLPHVGSTSTPRTAYSSTPPARSALSSPLTYASTSTASYGRPQAPPAAVYRPPPSHHSPYTPLDPASSTSSAHNPDTPFLADLAAFLSGLDPSLPHLAPLLYAVGITTMADLVVLRQMTPTCRTAMWGEMRRRGGALSSEEEERLERGLAGA